MGKMGEWEKIEKNRLAFDRLGKEDREGDVSDADSVFGDEAGHLTRTVLDRE